MSTHAQASLPHPSARWAGLKFDGPEATFVRSFATFVMGLFNLVGALIDSFLSGF